MNTQECEAAILRVQAASFQSELDAALQQELHQRVVATVRGVLEAALVEEVTDDLAHWDGPRPRRSGYYQRITDTQYGRIPDLRVPKLRWGNETREWQVLKRYEKGVRGWLDQVSALYVLGLSLRDLQVALYMQLGTVLSPTAINRVTLAVQQQYTAVCEAAIAQTPPVLIVDGVYVTILYPTGEWTTDAAGHLRAVMRAAERVILAALAVWPDGSYQLLHFTVAASEEESTWKAFLEQLITRGLDPQAVQLVVSDGTKGLLAATKALLPHARLQRCITHKVRGMQRYLQYGGLTAPTAPQQQQRWQELKADAYAIYDAPDRAGARQRLADFTTKWQALEPKAVHNFQWGFARTLEFYRFPPPLWPHIRTTNLLERRFRTFRTRADEIGAFPNETSCLGLFFMIARYEHAKLDRPFMANTL
jgi:putative transposase